MTDTPIRTYATEVVAAGRNRVDLDDFPPTVWEPGTPVPVVAGLPEGAELRRLCDVPEGWEWQITTGNWPNITEGGAHKSNTGLVLCRPKPVPAPPATEWVAWTNALLDKRRDPQSGAVLSDPWRDEVSGRVRFKRGDYPTCVEVDYLGMVEVLVDPAPTGDDEPADDANAREHRERTQADTALMALQMQTDTWRGDGISGFLTQWERDHEPQADTPAPQGRYDDERVPVPYFAGTVQTWNPLDDGKGEVNLIGSGLRTPNPNAWGSVVVYPAEVERFIADLVRRDGTAPSPDLTPLFDALDAYEKSQYGVDRMSLRHDVLTAVRALRDGATR